MKTTLLFAATTPFAVNPFLKTHLLALSEKYQVVLCVNQHAYPLTPDLRQHVDVIQVDFERKIAPLRDIRALFQLCVIIFRLSPRAIHSITPKAGLLTMFAGFITRTPFRHHTFTGQVWVNRKGLPRLFFKLFDRVIALLATHVFADSASQCQYLIKERIVSSRKISMLGKGSISGVELNRFKPSNDVYVRIRSALKTPESTVVFLFVGRLVRDKGIFDLLRAFSDLNKERDNNELWVVGPDEDGLLKQLKQLENDSVSIHWLGSTISPEQYMAAADVLVLPSYREGFGSVIVEAAACSIPTIAYRIDGVIDAVVENETGLLVEVGDVRALADSMRFLSDDVGQRKLLGKQAHDRAIKYFSSNAVTEEWLDYYHNIVDVID